MKAGVHISENVRGSLKNDGALVHVRETFRGEGTSWMLRLRDCAEAMPPCVGYICNELHFRKMTVRMQVVCAHLPLTESVPTD